MKKIFVVKLMLLSFLLMNVGITNGEIVMIENGKKVKFDYTLTVDGKTVDTSDGREPLEYTHGEGDIIPRLEKELDGLKVGDEKHVAIAATDAYGPVNPEAFQEVPGTMFPEDFNLQAGMMIPLQDKEGRTIPAVVKEVKEETVLLDFNHPLAGQDLTFDVKIVEIQ